MSTKDKKNKKKSTDRKTRGKDKDSDRSSDTASLIHSVAAKQFRLGNRYDYQIMLLA